MKHGPTCCDLNCHHRDFGVNKKSQKSTNFQGLIASDSSDALQEQQDPSNYLVQLINIQALYLYYVWGTHADIKQMIWTFGKGLLQELKRRLTSTAV